MSSGYGMRSATGRIEVSLARKVQLLRFSTYYEIVIKWCSLIKYYIQNKCPCKAPGDKVYTCNFLLRIWSPGASQWHFITLQSLEKRYWLQRQSTMASIHLESNYNVGVFPASFPPHFPFTWEKAEEMQAYFTDGHIWTGRKIIVTKTSAIIAWSWFPPGIMFLISHLSGHFTSHLESTPWCSKSDECKGNKLTPGFSLPSQVSPVNFSFIFH
jgi:hypothetical protein